MTYAKRQAAAVAAQRAMNNHHAQAPAATLTSTESPKRDPDHPMGDSLMDGGSDVKPSMMNDDASNLSHVSAGASRITNDPSQSLGRTSEAQRASTPGDPRGLSEPIPHPARQSWEYAEEVVQILKTAFPLLILSMETMVEQITLRFKATAEEEVYRLVCMLLQDAMQVCNLGYQPSPMFLT